MRDHAFLEQRAVERGELSDQRVRLVPVTAVLRHGSEQRQGVPGQKKRLVGQKRINGEVPDPGVREDVLLLVGPHTLPKVERELRRRAPEPEIPDRPAQESDLVPVDPA